MVRNLRAHKVQWLIVFLTFVLFPIRKLDGYSVLSHEALIDAVWQPVIVPLLLRRFPVATPEQLRKAHAYAYGGCVIQDMGYYPFGNHFFSDLTHYVRSADFIKALLEDSRNLDEYAFALGALSHYAADNTGHPLAVNLSVPDLYPKLEKKYGKRVTYEDDPKAHIMVEFSFDVVQVAGAGYLPKTYHNFIGFKVSKALLGRAFMQTYGINFAELFWNEGLSIDIYQLGASEVIPRLTQITWQQRRKKILSLYPAIVDRKYIYKVSSQNYARGPVASQKPPEFRLRKLTSQAKFKLEQAQLTLFARFLVFLVELLPKVGALQTLQFKAPTPHTQTLFINSFADTVQRYHGLLAGVAGNHLMLENTNFDTGKAIHAGDYELADKTYAELLKKLASDHFHRVTPEIRADILAFYGNLNGPIATKNHPRAWRKLLRELDLLKSREAQTQTAAEPGLVRIPPSPSDAP
ncbi:MAG: zinc dependent phospholipase C family protein [Terriglobia bacterium]